MANNRVPWRSDQHARHSGLDAYQEYPASHDQDAVLDDFDGFPFLMTQQVYTGAPYVDPRHLALDRTAPGACGGTEVSQDFGTSDYVPPGPGYDTVVYPHNPASDEAYMASLQMGPISSGGDFGSSD
ncbi:hypothetical protein diail_5667 [Diaporthe ilicicola]|nr:hypothetical protein diail_5667 [Diaporthe ilicicola]